VGALATAVAWSAKTILSNLEKRAEVLILEQLSYKPMSRPEIRKYIYGSHLLFRLAPFAYVNALETLAANDKIRLHEGVYSTPEN
jgi:hypothetical protein